MVVKVEHLSVVVCLPSPLERLDDLEEHLETLSHRKVTSKIFRCQKSLAAELLGFPEVGLDQAAGGVRALHDSAPLLGQGAQTIQLAEEIAGPVVRPTTSPLPDESGSQVIFLRPELVMEMRDEQSTFGRFFGRFGSSHFPAWECVEAVQWVFAEDVGARESANRKCLPHHFRKRRLRPQ